MMTTVTGAAFADLRAVRFTAGVGSVDGKAQKR